MTTDFLAQRIVKQGKVELTGTPEQVFPLLCPVRENDWVEGWRELAQLIYSESGIAEEGCVFVSNLPHEGEAVWVCSRYEPENNRVEYFKVITARAVIQLKLHVRANPNQTSILEITIVTTGLNDDGNQFIAQYAEHGVGMLNMLMEKGLNHYLTTGEMLRGFRKI